MNTLDPIVDLANRVGWHWWWKAFKFLSLNRVSRLCLAEGSEGVPSLDVRGFERRKPSLMLSSLALAVQRLRQPSWSCLGGSLVVVIGGWRWGDVQRWQDWRRSIVWARSVVVQHTCSNGSIFIISTTIHYPKDYIEANHEYSDSLTTTAGPLRLLPTPFVVLIVRHHLDECDACAQCAYEISEMTFWVDKTQALKSEWGHPFEGGWSHWKSFSSLLEW